MVWSAQESGHKSSKCFSLFLKIFIITTLFVGFLNPAQCILSGKQTPLFCFQFSNKNKRQLVLVLLTTLIYLQPLHAQQNCTLIMDEGVKASRFVSIVKIYESYQGTYPRTQLNRMFHNQQIWANIKNGQLRYVHLLFYLSALPILFFFNSYIKFPFILII